MSNIIELSALRAARIPNRALRSESVAPFEPHGTQRPRTARRMVFRSYNLIVQSDETNLMRDVCFDIDKAQSKLKSIQRQLHRDREHAAAREKLLTSAENKLNAAIVAAQSLTRTPKERAKKEAKAAAAAPPPATVTQLPRPRGSMLDQEFRAKLEELDESGRKFINGYMQTLLDQRGLR